MTELHLAQMNVARLRAPLDDPTIAEFVAGIDLMNELAARSPGHVWHLTDEEDDAVKNRIDPDMIVTMSVWTSLEDLRAYVYQSGHLEYLRRRRDWFVPEAGGATMVLWWVDAGHIPSLDEGLERMARVTTAGPGPEAFTFRKPFPAPIRV